MAAAAVMSGLHQAAERNGGLAAGPASVDLKSARYMCWRAVVLEDAYQIMSAPDEVKADRELMFAVVRATSGWGLQFADEVLKNDKDLVLAAVKADASSLAHAAGALRNNRAFVTEAVQANGAALEGASDEFRRDRNFILDAASKGQGSALKGAADNLKADAGFVRDCVSRDASALQHAAESLRESKEFLLSAARANGGSLEFMPARFRADAEIVAAAAQQATVAVGFAHSARRYDLAGPKTASIVETDFKANMGALRSLGVPLNDVDHVAQYTCEKIQKYVVFTAMSTFTPNMGQSNYIAANAWLDKVVGYSRPECDTIALSWGTVGGMGMRWKAFASQDFMNATPDLLLSIPDSCKILNLVTTRMGTPEWMAANFFDEGQRWQMLQKTTSQEDYASVRLPSKPEEEEPQKENIADNSKAAAVERGRNSEVPHTGPLGGWVSLAASRASEEIGSHVEPCEGARVQLTGLSTRDSFIGEVLKVYPEGKCRVKLDDGKGNALVKTAHLLVIA